MTGSSFMAYLRAGFLSRFQQDAPSGMTGPHYQAGLGRQACKGGAALEEESCLWTQNAGWWGLQASIHGEYRCYRSVLALVG